MTKSQTIFIRSFSKQVILISCLVIVVACLSTIFTSKASALSGANFNAGRIMDDGIFYNPHSMSTQQIQNFLNAKVPVCDTNGQKMINSSQTRAQWAQANGKPLPPYICLKDYSQNIQSITNGGSDLCTGSISGGTKSAAQIINDVSKACGINPQVLLVLLQKEQSLVTDEWPWPIQYRSATGYGCPDTAPCDAQFYGFFNQVYQAAKGYKRYAANPHNYNYRAGRNNTILWHPNHACGSSTVFIENQATAGLYIYTPYRPNQAALNNLYGTGDGCSSYGNRNFWRMFSDWFGTTYADGYVAQFNAQSNLNEPFYPGESKTVYIQYKNLGSARWYDDTTAPAGITPVHLAASVPTNRRSVFSYGWPSDGRPNLTFSKVYEADGTTLATNQHAVEPGQIARFEFKITPPWNVNLGVHREHFQPVLEGASSWSMGGVAWLDINIESRYKAAFHKQSAYPTLRQNETVTLSYFEFRNSGSAAWYDDTSVPAGYFPTHLATTSPINRWSGFGASWPNQFYRPNLLFTKVFEGDGVTLAGHQHIVMPGQIARYEFSMSAPLSITTGFYRESFQPILEGAPHPFMNGTAWLDVNVITSTSQAQFHSQSAHPVVIRGQAFPSFIQYKNAGNTKWYDDTSVPTGMSPIHLAASNPTNRQSVFSYGWLSAGRPNFTFSKVYETNGTTLAANQHTVEPGQIARFEFNITAPWNINPGIHREHFQPVLEWAHNWNIGGLAWLDVKVNP